MQAGCGDEACGSGDVLHGAGVLDSRELCEVQAVESSGVRMCGCRVCECV